MGFGGLPMGSPCCDDFARNLAPCKEHARKQPKPPGELTDCPDQMVAWSDQHGFGLPVRDGGESRISITHCPWCGEKLPKP